MSMTETPKATPATQAEPPAMPPAAPKSGGGFWAGVMVLGLGIGAGGAGLYWAMEKGLIPTPQSEAQKAQAETIADLKAALEAFSGELKAAKPDQALPGRIAALEAKPALTAEQSETLARAAAAADRLDGEVKTLADGVAELKKRMSAVEARPDPEGLDRRILSLEGRVGGIPDLAAARKAEAKALAALSLRRAVESGAGFTRDLDLAAATLGDDAAFGVLRPEAVAGIPTPLELKRLFARHAAVAQRAAQSGPDGTWQDRLWGWLSGIIRIRPVGEPQGADAPAVLARIEARLDETDVAGALKEADALTGGAAEAMLPWRQAAERRQNVLAALDGLEGRLLGHTAQTAAPQAAQP